MSPSVSLVLVTDTDLSKRHEQRSRQKLPIPNKRRSQIWKKCLFMLLINSILRYHGDVPLAIICLRRDTIFCRPNLVEI